MSTNQPPPWLQSENSELPDEQPDSRPAPDHQPAPGEHDENRREFSHPHTPPQPEPSQPEPPQTYPVYEQPIQHYPPQHYPPQHYPPQHYPPQHQAPPHQPPPHQGPPLPGAPTAAAHQHITSLSQIAPDHPSRHRPQSGWRRALHTASGGLINLGESAGQQRINELVNATRQPIVGDFRLAVLSLKGGVGKTSTTVGLGSAFASLRGDRVIAFDANPDLGTLVRRVPRQTDATVRDLLNDPHPTRYADVRKYTNQSPSRLEVLASERDPSVSESFSADDYHRALAILQNHYNIILTDCGTGLMHSAMSAVLSSAHAIVLVTSPAIDGAESASATLDWLDAHQYGHLVRNALVVISSSTPGNAPIDTDMLTQYFLGRTRAVQVIPFDQHLATGSHIDMDQLHRKTRTAYLELAATIAQQFGTQHPPR